MKYNKRVNYNKARNNKSYDKSKYHKQQPYKSLTKKHDMNVYRSDTYDSYDEYKSDIRRQKDIQMQAKKARLKEDLLNKYSRGDI